LEDDEENHTTFKLVYMSGLKRVVKKNATIKTDMHRNDQKEP
jgi:hypothetical protein